MSVPALSRASAPILYGDGLHDDTEALNALLCQRDVIHDHKVYRRGLDIEIIDGEYRISGSLRTCAGTIRIGRVDLLTPYGRMTLQNWYITFAEKLETFAKDREREFLTLLPITAGTKELAHRP